MTEHTFVYYLGGMDVEPVSPGDELSPLIEALKEKAEKLGLYLGDAMVATHDTELAEDVGSTRTVRDAIADGAEFVILTNFAIGQVAWRKRTQDPEQYEIDKQVQVMLPDPADEIRRRLESGGSLFEEDDDDTA